MVTNEIRPQSGPQEQFLATDADIAIYGGAAGGGKTFGLLMMPLHHINNSDFGAVIFRRTLRQVMNQGGMWDEASKLYPLLGAEPRRGDMEWRFPTGARVQFAHLVHDDTQFDWQGAQIPLIGFDELTHFTTDQFWYLLSRNRSTCGVKPYVRATCNPSPDHLAAQLVAWWIGDDGYPILERSGVIRWFARVSGDLHWADTRQALVDKFGPEAMPRSFTFIPARLEDNPALLKANPEYKANLLALPLVERERLLGGNWHVRPEGGKLFHRDWVQAEIASPQGGTLCRFWDFAATAKKLAKDDPDYTASVLMRRLERTWWIEDMVAVQKGPMATEAMFRDQAWKDHALANQTGAAYRLRWELEPGSAARRDAARMSSLVAGIDAKAIPSRDDKIVRARAFLAQAEAGNVALKAGPWNERWLNHMHNQPTAPHDDIWDATSGSFNALLDIGGTRQARSRQG